MANDFMEGFGENVFRPDAMKSFIRVVKRVIAEGGLDVEPLEKMVKGLLDEDRIRKSPTGLEW
jgi:hypothetical protein